MKKFWLQRQVNQADCGVAAISTYLDVPYEDALNAIHIAAPQAIFSVPWAKSSDNRHRGMYIREIAAAAELMGKPLVKRVRGQYDPDVDEGIISLRADNGWHFATLAFGVILDPEGYVTPWRELLKTGWRLCTLLTRPEGL
jgi:hypothetical protein